MKTMIAVFVTLSALCGSAHAQGIRRLPVDVLYPGPLNGSVHRRAIPNEFLEVSMDRGTIHIQGVSSDSVAWSVVVLSWDPAVAQPDGRPMVSPASNGRAVAAAAPDHYTLELGAIPSVAANGSHADAILRVPRDLKLLHVTVHGGGDVVVDNFAGELTVTADSGTIVGAKLGGSVLFESRNGGIDLDVSEGFAPRGPVNLLSHNGSIDLLLAPQPSVVLDVKTSCGTVESDFAAGGFTPVPGDPRSAQVPVNGFPEFTIGNPGPAVDCSLRPAWLPQMPGVKSQHYSLRGMLGAGSYVLHATALQGDVHLRKSTATATTTTTQCLLYSYFDKYVDGLPMVLTIVGRVTDADGRKPLAAARVQLVGTQYAAVSDETGTYRIKFDAHLLDECRPLRIQVSAAGHAGSVRRIFGGAGQAGQVALPRTTGVNWLRLLPDTPGGRTVGEWIRVMNSGDSLEMRRYARDRTLYAAGKDSVYLDGAAGRMMRSHAESGEIVPYELRASDEQHIALITELPKQGKARAYVFEFERSAPYRLIVSMTYPKDPF